MSSHCVFDLWHHFVASLCFINVCHRDVPSVYSFHFQCDSIFLHFVSSIWFTTLCHISLFNQRLSLFCVLNLCHHFVNLNFEITLLSFWVITLCHQFVLSLCNIILCHQFVSKTCVITLWHHILSSLCVITFFSSL